MRLPRRPRRPGNGAVLTALAVLAGALLPSQARAQAVTISAQVDKTAVNLGAQITLTITIEGDVEHVQLQKFEFPEALPVVAQSRASNVSISPGEVKRSVSLMFVLAAQQPGTFQLGPFKATHQNQDVSTQPIEIVVNKPVVPPALPGTHRYML